MITTRFASAAEYLDSIIRSRFVLRILVKDSEFENVFSVKTEGERKSRNDIFIDKIKCDVFMENVKAVHEILSSVRNCLRIFDKDENNVGDVIQLINIFHSALSGLPLCEFFTSNRKAEVLQKFYNLRDGIDGKPTKIKACLILKSITPSTVWIHVGIN